MNKYFVYVIYTNTTISKLWVDDKQVTDLVLNSSALSIGNICRLSTDQVAVVIPSTTILAWTSIPEISPLELLSIKTISPLEHLSHQESPLEKETTARMIYNWNNYTK